MEARRATDSHARIAIAVALVAWLALALRFWWTCDDALISFRFARHLARGDGLVFNLGRVPPVEGYSNFLWVVVLALGERMGLSAPWVANVLSAACGALLLVWVVRFARAHFDLGPRGSAATGLFLATLPAFPLWSTGGLAAMPFALAVFGLFAFSHGAPGATPRFVPAVLCGLAAGLLRADGALWVGLVLGAGLCLRRERLTLFAIGVSVALGVAAHFLWRHSYYGEWLPQTARVKAGFSVERLERGLRYVAAWALSLPALLLVGLAAAGVLLPTRRRPPGSAATLVSAAVVLAGSLAYAIWVGGDFMPFGRFLFPVVPFVALVFSLLWRASADGAERWASPVGALSAACLALSVAGSFDRHAVPRSLRQRVDFRWDRQWQSEVERWDEMRLNARRWRILGRAVALHTKPGESLVSGAIGALGYETELFLWDTYGLVTPEVLELGRLVPRSSPGHDIRVNERDLFERADYAYAYLTPGAGLAAGDPLPWWTDFRAPDWTRHQLGPLFDVERYPLAEADGFPPGSVLVLLRLK